MSNGIDPRPRPGVLDVDDNGKWFTWVDDGGGGVRRETEAEAAARGKQFWQNLSAESQAFHAGWERAVYDDDFTPTPTARYMEYLVWSKGLAPHYRPSMADRLMLTAEHLRSIYTSKNQAASSSTIQPSTFDKQERLILAALARDPQSAWIVTELAGATVRVIDKNGSMVETAAPSRGTIVNRTPGMLQKKAIFYPKGPNQGIQITDSGLAAHNILNKG